MIKYAFFYFPPDYPIFLKKIIGTKLYNLLIKGCLQKRNPRNLEYLTQSVRTHFGENIHLLDLKFAVLSDVEKGSFVVLWPDAIGYGWLAMERKLKKHFKIQEILVLTGRQRILTLAISLRSGKYWSLLVRRFNEKFMLGELLFTLFFLILTPFIFIYDLIRLRK